MTCVEYPVRTGRSLPVPLPLPPDPNHGASSNDGSPPRLRDDFQLADTSESEATFKGGQWGLLEGAAHSNSSYCRILGEPSRSGWLLWVAMMSSSMARDRSPESRRRRSISLNLRSRGDRPVPVTQGTAAPTGGRRQVSEPAAVPLTTTTGCSQSEAANHGVSVSDSKWPFGAPTTHVPPRQLTTVPAEAVG